MPRLAFSGQPFMEDIGGRKVFQPRPDLMMMHLSHPMMQRALSSLTRRRFPGTGDQVSRWTVRHGDVPNGSDAVILLSVEELAVNDLRESFHHWVRTIALPVKNGELGEPLQHASAEQWRGNGKPLSDSEKTRASALFDDVEPDLKDILRSHAVELSNALGDALVGMGARTAKEEEERYRSRQGEVSTLIAESTLQKLEKEITKLQLEKAQGLLFDQDRTIEEIDRSIERKHEEIARRKRHYEEVRGQLERERERILKHLLPKRYAMAGTAQVFPVSVEIRLPKGAQ
jgi:hypothetical protein